MTNTTTPSVVFSKLNMLSIILLALALPPSEVVLIEYNCPRMTVPTTRRTPTMITASTVPVSWFVIPRLCLTSISFFHLRSEKISVDTVSCWFRVFRAISSNT